MGVMNKCGVLAVLLAVFVGGIVPVLISHSAGGWTRKYTSNPGFSAADIPSMEGKGNVRDPLPPHSTH